MGADISTSSMMGLSSLFASSASHGVLDADQGNSSGIWSPSEFAFVGKTSVTKMSHDVPALSGAELVLLESLMVTLKGFSSSTFCGFFSLSYVSLGL